uniref:Uncharacterized protein n=1 Tax=Rhizophora mucronata TaxID=61149 RepID=A0A2P2Q7R5_RHIMU
MSILVSKLLDLSQELKLVMNFSTGSSLILLAFIVQFRVV